MACEGSAPIVLICGPRKVGKSTFCRFLLNTLLNHRDEICHMDLDPGQTEFMPPGFITLELISEPLTSNARAAGGLFLIPCRPSVWSRPLCAPQPIPGVCQRGRESRPLLPMLQISFRDLSDTAPSTPAGGQHHGLGYGPRPAPLAGRGADRPSHPHCQF